MQENMPSLVKSQWPSTKIEFTSECRSPSCHIKIYLCLSLLEAYKIYHAKWEAWTMMWRGGP